MRKILVLLAGLAVAAPLFAQTKEDDRLRESVVVLKAVLGDPDKGVPHDILDKSECVIVYPGVKKAAFVFGASYGRGVITCRTGDDFGGLWGPPAMFALEGASFGLQAGGQATDFVLLVMNQAGSASVLKSKVKIGGDASAAAGPVGRNASAETDAVMKAEILSWSRARGVFAGVSLSGSTVRSDDGANKDLYGQELTATEIVRGGKVKTTTAGQPLLDYLNQVSPKHVSS